MSEKYRVDTLILDLDGTVADTRWDIARAANYALGQFGFPELPKDRLASFIGGGAKPLLLKALGEGNEEWFDQVFPVFKDYYFEHCTEDTTLFPGVHEVLEFFRGRNVAMATNKLSAMTRKILEHFGINEYFQVVLGPDSVENRKPHPESIDRILEELDAPRETAMIVGDSPIDIETGRRAGIVTCGVTYGQITPVQEIIDAEPDLLLDRLEDLLKHVC